MKTELQSPRHLEENAPASSPAFAPPAFVSVGRLGLLRLLGAVALAGCRVALAPTDDASSKPATEPAGESPGETGDDAGSDPNASPSPDPANDPSSRVAATDPTDGSADCPMPTLAFKDSDGLKVTRACQSGQSLDITFQTSAIFDPVHVHVLLPNGYSGAAGTAYPSLYLFHGAHVSSDQKFPVEDVENAVLWTDHGVAQLVATAKFNGIIVMPEAGRSGWYSDWRQADDNGHRPLWKTFHLTQLLPWIDHNFQTNASKDQRFVAGYSMGGYGALAYAAQAPDLFSAVGAFSPVVDLSDQAGADVLDLSMSTAITKAESDSGNYGVQSGGLARVFGVGNSPQKADTSSSPATSANAAVYANNGIRLAIYSGNGNVPGGTLPDFVEAGIGAEQAGFNKLLDESQAQYRACLGAGGHDWPWWQQDLSDFLAMIQGTTPTSCPNGWGAPSGKGWMAGAPSSSLYMANGDMDVCSVTQGADGTYCGASLQSSSAMGDVNTLYTCSAGATTTTQPCASGCAAGSPDGSDACN